jgi:hypothetical protein
MLPLVQGKVGRVSQGRDLKQSEEGLERRSSIKFSGFGVQVRIRDDNSRGGDEKIVFPE